MLPIGALPLASLDWRPCHRLIASRFPTVGLFDQIADPADLEVVFAIEMLSNPRLRQELGQISLVPPAQRVTGPGATLLMSAFTHLNPEGSRFSDGSVGVYYAAASLATAVAEVSHHRARFLARTHEAEINLDLRWIQADLLHSALHDIRRASLGGALTNAALDAVYDPEVYGHGQQLGQALRAVGSAALVYDSVRDAQGQCVAVFQPRALANARAAGHLGLHWDGQRISHWFHIGEPQPLTAATGLTAS